MKRILTIQDISCIGKCSLTVALPIISAFGVETAVLPTAVLSAHTMFDGFTFRDLTDDIVPITEHWKKEKITFDSIYTGYLGSARQIDLISHLFSEFKTTDNLIIVDPVMADNGKLYPGFDKAFSANMAKLCQKADIIVPNITEASFMTGMDYKENYDESYIREMMKKLSALGARLSILTGVSFDKDKIGVMGYDREKDEYFYYENKRIDAVFHGTGDIFSSTFTGALSREKTWKEAIPIAADYTARCIQLTVDDDNRSWYGVNFEEAIPYLLERIIK